MLHELYRLNFSNFAGVSAISQPKKQKRRRISPPEPQSICHETVSRYESLDQGWKAPSDPAEATLTMISCEARQHRAVPVGVGVTNGDSSGR